MPGRQGSIRLFSYSGIDVFLHWSWFLIAMYEIRGGLGTYSSIGWNIAEYLALFLIVTIHEFGHALACRQVGGFANRIVLWPMGGVAYVDPPPRPGATLWSIAAGPLVNVALLPVLWIVVRASRIAGLPASQHDLFRSCRRSSTSISDCWFSTSCPSTRWMAAKFCVPCSGIVMGRARSLMVATILGLLGVFGFIALAVVRGSLWLGAIAVFVLLNCWGGFQHARVLLRMAKLPRRAGYSCPTCNSAPPLGAYWKCNQCGQAFDTFETGAACPACRAQFPATRCLDCGRQHSQHAWASPALAGATELTSSTAR